MKRYPPLYADQLTLQKFSNKMTNGLDLDSILGSTAFAGSVDAAILMGQNGKRRVIRSHPRYLRDAEIPRSTVHMDFSTGVVELGSPAPSEDDEGEGDTSPSLSVSEQLAKNLLNWYEVNNLQCSRTALVEHYGGNKQAGLRALKDAYEKEWFTEVLKDGKPIIVTQEFSPTT